MGVTMRGLLMKNIAVLGIGNRLLMDDGVGLYTVEALKELSYGNSLCYKLT